MSAPTKTVYVDGACTLQGGPDADGKHFGPGGWAWVEMKADGSGIRFSRSGSDPYTTNQRMELTAALEALRAFRGHHRLVIVSDSAYVVNCMNDGWYHNWVANDWRNASGKPVANRDLWEDILVELAGWEEGALEWRHVKGHGTDPGNIAADLKAVEAKMRVKS